MKGTAARSSFDKIRERENGSMKGRDELNQKISESQNGQKLSHGYKCLWQWVNEVQEQNDEIIRIFHHRKMRKFLLEPDIGNQVIIIGHFPPPREMRPPPQPSPAVAFFLVWSKRSRASICVQEATMARWSSCLHARSLAAIEGES